jgi:organic hydroperoxide reductase OsmC/OhrA
MKGSVRDRSLHSGALALETRVEIESSDPPERIQELVRMAEQSCFTLGAWTQPVPTSVSATLNGEPLEVEGRGGA